MTRSGLAQRLGFYVKRAWLRPSLPMTRKAKGAVRLGSGYGGWWLEDDDALKGATIISAGVGEDMSFDIDMARRYGCTVVLVDPTPRAMVHVREVQMVLAGTAPVTVSPAVRAYDLNGVKAEQFVLEPCALWHQDTVVRFYAPAQAHNVSHSITNLQNTESFIEVQARPLSSLLDRHGIADLALFKLDIEGAETMVLSDMMARSILPRQILVEFDDLTFPSRRSGTAVRHTYERLIAAGYDLIAVEAQNFTFRRRF